MKGIGIILVVLGHTIQNSLYEWIYMFHMPLFFFISGLLLKPNSSTFLKRAKTLLIPYLIFATATYLYWRFLEIRFRPLPEGFDANRHFLDIFWQTEEFKFNSPLWFLPCLFLASTILNLLLLATRSMKVVACILLLSVVCLSAYEPQVDSIWIKGAVCALPFSLAGWLCGNYVSELEVKLSTVAWQYKLISLVVLTSMAFVPCSGSMQHFPHGYGYYFIVATICIAAVLAFSSMLTKHSWLTWLGRNTLTIMCLHDPLKRIVLKVASVITNQDIEALRQSAVASLAVTSVVILLLVPVCMVINSRFKWLLGRF